MNSKSSKRSFNVTFVSNLFKMKVFLPLWVSMKENNIIEFAIMMDKVSVGCLVYLIVVYAMIVGIKRTKLDSIHLNGNI